MNLASSSNCSLFRFLTGVLCSLLSIAINAELIDRGNGLIYDSTQDITWLQDANFSKTSGYAVGGRMTWDQSAVWIAHLNNTNHLGFTDWRLPTTLQPDASCSKQNTLFGPLFSVEYDCTGSEMGHLYYAAPPHGLGNISGATAGCTIFTNCGLLNLGPFTNIEMMNGIYWSSTGWVVLPDLAKYFFDFKIGWQNATIKNDPNGLAWAIRDGDVVQDGDEDEDGVADVDDLCPGTAASDPADSNGCSDAQVDSDGDGACDPGAVSSGPSACTGTDVFPNDPTESSDGDDDGVGDNGDICPNTSIPESVPTKGLNSNRWALTADNDPFDFDTIAKGSSYSYTTADTAGCSCEQIIEAQGLGNGHTKHGCSIGAMDDWVTAH